MNASKAIIGAIVMIVGSCICAGSGAQAEFTPRKGFVTLQFDDSHDHHYIYIYPMLERHGFKGTFAFVTEAFDLGIESGRTWRIQELPISNH